MALDRVQIYSSKSFRIFTVQLDWRTPSWKIYHLFGWLDRPLFAKKFYAEVLIAKLINRYTPRISLIVFGGWV